MRRSPGFGIVAKGVPSDASCDPDLGCGWTDDHPHEALPPIWPFSLRRRARKYPIVRMAVLCVIAPHLETFCQTRVERNRFLRCLSFARTNDLEHDGPYDAN